jgi:hypothetical protein
METLGDKITSKNIKKFVCENCDFRCSKHGDWSRHKMTAKHKNNEIGDKIGDTGDAKNIKNKFACEFCNKNYNSRNGLWKHKKFCLNDKNIDTENKDQLIMMLVKQNSDLIKETTDLKTMIMEVIKNGTHNTTNNNSHNKSFNLNLFLNETCKDAMNIMDFVNSIKFQLSDLEKVGELGYIEGISKIIVSNLNLLDETKRPVHCADSKREVMYVKDDNKWEKESADKTKLRNAIKRVTQHNTKLLKEFRIKYPGCDKSDSKYSTKYDKLTLEAFGGKGDDYEGKENKIIRNIAKNVIIDKAIN